MTTRVADRFRRFDAVLSSKFGVSLGVTLRTGRSSEFPKSRDFAYCKLENGKLSIVVAPKMHRASLARIDGLLAHEFGHALLLSAGQYDHTERAADAAAEAAFDLQIAYDRGDVQTTGPGVRPRPAYLDRARRPPLRRNGNRSALVAHLVCACGMDRADAERIAPTKDVASPRRALSPEQLRKFEATVRRRVDDPAVRTLLLLLPATGMRVGEACALEMDAFAETRRGRLRAGVVGKGNKPRTVTLGRRGTALVRAYLRERPASASDRVFVGPRGGKITPAMVQAACRDVAAVLGAPITPHVLRHTYATIRVLECRDLESLRVQLGHGKLDGKRKTKRLPQVTMTYLDF